MVTTNELGHELCHTTNDSKNVRSPHKRPFEVPTEPDMNTAGGIERIVCIVNKVCFVKCVVSMFLCEVLFPFCLNSIFPVILLAETQFKSTFFSLKSLLRIVSRKLSY